MAIQTVNPATGNVEQEYAPHGPAEVERRLAQAESAYRHMRRTSRAQRADWLRCAADLLDADRDDLARTLVREMGKPIGQALAEVAKSARALRFYADHAEGFLAERSLDDPARVGASGAGTRYDPIGAVLAVMPWNYPIWQVIRFAAPALAAGNVGVLKHASNVPQSALYLDTLFERAGFPDGAFRTLLIGSDAVDAVIADPRIAAVTLTGSEQAGRSVGAAAGAAIKKTVLELGGSDPFLVMPSADLEVASTEAVRGRVLNNGQSCIGAKRFIVHADVYDRFSELFAAKVAALRVGDPMDPDVEVGPLATRSGRDELAGLVDDAAAKGARILVGGTTPERPGWFYSPTVIAELTDDMLLVQEEAFGPVASLYRAEDREDALRIANQTRFGLSSSLWTKDPEEEAWFVRNLEVGAVFVNGITVSHAELPFGGIKASGYGRELAAEGIREFMNVKTVWRA